MPALKTRLWVLGAQRSDRGLNYRPVPMAVLPLKGLRAIPANGCAGDESAKSRRSLAPCCRPQSRGSHGQCFWPQTRTTPGIREAPSPPQPAFPFPLPLYRPPAWPSGRRISTGSPCKTHKPSSRAFNGKRNRDGRRHKLPPRSRTTTFGRHIVTVGGLQRKVTPAASF